MILKVGLLLFLSCIVCLAEDDKKWVWGQNGRQASGLVDFDREERYEVHEEGERPFRPSRPYNELSAYEPGYTPPFRPGGVYGGSPSGNYGPSHNHNQYPEEVSNTDVLTGPVPSWVKEGPFKNYDKCKCTERFNCKSPGISYGHCDAGKQYCCYATKKVDQIGEPNPTRPHHSIDNGILVGPDGPYDVPRPGSFGGRPGSFGGRPGSFGGRPGNFGGRPVRPGGFGVGGGSGSYHPTGNRPSYSAQNGVLVGPGGPYDKHYGGSPGGFGYGRSATKTDN